MARRTEEFTARPGDEATTLRLQDGRSFRLACYGDPAGLAVLALHGTPGSRLKFQIADGTARSMGLRLICPDRWGYGGTPMHPAPSLHAFAQDVAAIADELGLQRFAVVGVSGGGPFATAVAAWLPRRISALALVAPVGPVTMRPPPGVNGPYSLFHRLCFEALPKVPGAMAAAFGAFRALSIWRPEIAAQVAVARGCPSDRAIVAAAGRELGAVFREGLAQSTSGAVADMALFSRSWNVPFGSIAAPTCIWIGSADRNVPLRAVEVLAQTVPGAQLTRLPGVGHYWIVEHYAEVLGWLSSNRLS